MNVHYMNKIMEEEFSKRLENWQKNTMFDSNINVILKDENIEWMIQQGSQIIPLIISSIKNTPSNLAFVIPIITKEPFKLKDNTYKPEKDGFISFNIDDVCNKLIKKYDLKDENNIS